MLRLTLIIVFFSLLNACAVHPPKPDSQNSLSKISCLNFYSEFDALIDGDFEDEVSSIRDVQASILPDYPYLSINRFLVSLKSELNSSEKLNYWLSELAALNLQARKVEWLNLSSAERQEFSATFLPDVSFNQNLSECSSLLLSKISENEKREILTSAKVKDDYNIVQRFLGLYPLTSLYVSSQIDKHQLQTQSLFRKPLNEIPVKGQLKRYGLVSNKENIKPIFSRDNPLKMPLLDQETLDALFLKHAPILEIDEEDENDVVGQIILNKDNQPDFSSDRSVYYVLPSYTKFNGKVLLQLNYVFWFASRPQKRTFDIYSGKLDGLIWRVTLDASGEPLIYDSVHNCGCYHKFYPGENMAFNNEVASQEPEPPFVAQKITSLQDGERIVIRIGSVAHFVNRVYKQFPKADMQNIEVRPYSDLRSLEREGYRRSMFASDGLVEGTDRAERWLLWPMGVPSAGAMRQWGHHAVAFVGKRYFDDPELLDKYFTKK